MSALHFETALDLAARIRAKEIGCLELLDHFLARVDRYNPDLNAIIWMDADAARERARAADHALANGELWGPLHGVPMTIKESFNVAGAPTTWGRPELANNVATTDAVSVARFKAAGAVLFGKTNVPINLADWQSFNVIYGTTNNPWDVTRTPGGSSGGSAAALAAGLTGIDAGSDIGASIRNPAHYCGVFGHKPSYGALSAFGHAMPGAVSSPDISVVGPLARSAADLTLGLDIMAGPDPLDALAWRLELPAARATRLGEFRVALKLDDACCDVDDEYKAALQSVADTLAHAGATVSDRAVPEIDFARAHRLYIELLRAATSGRQSDEEIAHWEGVVEQTRDDDASYVAIMARGNTLAHRDWIACNNERHQQRLAWQAFFEDWDVLLCPVAASAAWPHDQAGDRHERTIVVNGREQLTTDQLFWAGIASSVYLPASVAPIARTRDGLPLGVQIMTGYLNDRTAIAFADALSREIGGFEAPPGY